MTSESPLNRLLEIIEEAAYNGSPTSLNKEKNQQIKCPHHFGYLFKLQKNTPIPEECFFCSRVIECIAPQ